MKTDKKFKLTEKNAINAPVKNIEWEGEELQAQSKTHLEQDLGTGAKTVYRFFEFAANPEAFKNRKPTAQELFNDNKKGIMAMLWKDELRPLEQIEPRLIFSKNKKFFRIIIICVSTSIIGILEDTKTLSQLLR